MTKQLKLILFLSAALPFAVHAAGPATTQVSAADYSRVAYVSAGNGSDTDGNGNMKSPWATIGHALSTVRGKNVAVFVASGLYEEHSLVMRPGVHIFGGFSDGDWSRDVLVKRSVIEAGGQGRVFTAANEATLDGFEVRGGVVRGPGAGVFIDGTSPVLSNNTFAANKTLGPEDWNPEYWHETANDGGGVYCTNGGKPEIQNNLFAANQTDNGRGAGLAFDHGCDGVIADNVFIGNTAGLDDPMRSSDGGAISIFRWSSPEISNNIVLNNMALSNNDAGGIFVALWSSPKVIGNTIVSNEAGDDAGGLFVGGQEHRYDAPLDPIPPADKFFVEVIGNHFYGNRNSSRNSGATRITMESRGRVAENIAALNLGFYIQRSELEVVNNTILENTLLIETKEGLKPSRVSNNIILGSLEFEPVAEITGNLLQEELAGNQRGVPTFLNDSRSLHVTTASYSKALFQSTLHVAESLHAEELQGRTVYSGNRWGVVHDVDGNQLVVWGNLSDAKQIDVVATYRQTSSSPGFGKGADADRATTTYQPQRVNKSIELLERKQPIYYASGSGGYDNGIRMADTWADYIVYNMEHQPLDFASLREFMRGLVDAGPTSSGHRTPTVIVVLPLLGLDEQTVTSGGWMVQQALAQGVHGVHLARARDPDAVKRFVQAARYPVHKQEIEVVGEGLRGWGSHIFASWVWGLDREEYLRKADVWPLNPDGEILLGVKLEDQQALANAAQTLAVPGLAFAEHGPRDLGLSFGHLEGRADPPLPAEVVEAGDFVLKLTGENGLYFLDNVLPGNVKQQLDRGVMIGAGRREDAAEIGRAHTERSMPW